MKEIQDILRNYAAARAANQPCALATIVRVAGSTYRRPGARMLITSDGQSTGCISGGCLERAVCDHAQRVMVTRQPILVAFDSQTQEDVLFGLGLGCRGVVEVLIEPLNDSCEHMTFLAQNMEGRNISVLATVFAVEGRISSTVGDRMMIRESGEISTDIADPALRGAVEIDARGVLNGKSKTFFYDVPGGNAGVLIERVTPPLSLSIFGVGHDAIPLAQLATTLGWHVTLIDCRPANVSRARNHTNCRIIEARPEEIGSEMTLSPGSVAVVMNHNYLDDLAVLENIIHSPLSYIGILGPRSRTDRLLVDLRKRGVSWTAADFDRIYAPAGLDIGADNPEEIALSIVAEIQGVISGRSGESLREKSGPLHARPMVAQAALATQNVAHENCSVG